MKENLYYLFLTGIILGSGPCLSFCGPLLISYAAAHKKSLRESFLSYLTFSVSKLFSYVILGLICAFGTKALQDPVLQRYSQSIYLFLGCFIVLLGVATIFDKGARLSMLCSRLHQGHVKNVGLFGLLVGFSPCPPLLGILNYIVVVSRTPLDAIIFSFVFGFGTVISPLVILMMFSAKASSLLSQNKKIKMMIKVLCGLILIVLGSRIVFKMIL
ncbi:MAG: sulfite exporter TauE/SafE family protein [Candidatus Aceula lacicola]|nr:sulfite exporter TauE/SafE family protein [Candidatus Aceula lacicola]